MQLYTYQDAVRHLIDYLGGDVSEVVVRDCKRAIQAAYRDLANCHNWTCLYRLSRVNTVPVYDTGTIAFDLTGGARERLVTLTGGTWPSWAGDAFIRVGPVNYRVGEVVSPTTLTLRPELSPAEDLPAGTVYSLYLDSYLLPEDFIAQDQALYQQNFGAMQYTHPREWAYENRYVFARGVPQLFTILPDENRPNRLTLRVFPFPVEAKTIDFVYKRRPRTLQVETYTAGVASVLGGGTVLTAPSAAFTTSMEGAAVRMSANGTTAPTGWLDANPPAFESLVASVASATQLRLTDPAPAALSNVKWTLSDPVDIEPGSMLNAFLRGCEYQLSLTRTLKDKPSARAAYQDALDAARAADSRSFAGRSEGQILKFRQRLRDMPLGPDQP